MVVNPYCIDTSPMRGGSRRSANRATRRGGAMQGMVGDTPRHGFDASWEYNHRVGVCQGADDDIPLDKRLDIH